VSKQKSEPQKTRAARKPKAAPAADAVGAPASADPAAPTPNRRLRKAKAGAAGSAKPARPARRARGAGAAAEDERISQVGDDDREAEHDEHGDGDGDGEVVEVVGEIVDEHALDGEEVGDDDEAAPRPSSLPGGNEFALSRTDPLQAYLREVQRHSLLSPDEEKRLTQHYYKNQDVQTAARLVTANLRLVVKLAYEYRRAYKNIMDLIQEGNIGLMQAVKRYDPYRGVKLSSYAAWWIRAYILRFILNNWRLVKLGTTQAQRKLFFNLNKEKARLSALGIEPTAAEIAKRLMVEEKEVVDMDRRLSSGEASLDAPAGDAEGRAVSRVELMPSAASGPDVVMEANEVGRLVQDRLRKFRATLKGKDVTIFDKRMAAEDPLTLQELGDEFGISRERVRQLEARLTVKLREYLKEELGDAVGTS